MFTFTEPNCEIFSCYQFLKEGHLRWDSLGEYLATAIGFQVINREDRQISLYRTIKCSSAGIAKSNKLFCLIDRQDIGKIG